MFSFVDLSHSAGADLVQDLDIVVWGDKAEAVDKTGVSIDGPDAGTDPSSYLDDSAVAAQDVASAVAHLGGNSFTRTDKDEGTEAQTGGNGLTGNDETSENLSTTFAEVATTPNGGSLLGIGAEPLIVAITCALAKWFKGKELAFAFGVNLTIARLGSYAADLSPTWASTAYEGGWQPPLVLAAVIGGLCIVGAIVYGILEIAAKRKYTLGEAGETDKLVLSDLFTFSRSFWFITLLCVVFYSAIFPFRSFSIKYFIEAWDVARDVAALCPEATFVNYSNPMTANCWAIRQATGVPVVGLCHAIEPCICPTSPTLLYSGVSGQFTGFPR